MQPPKDRRRSGLVLAVALAATGWTSAVEAGSKRPDPEQVVPMAQVPPQHREVVAEVIRDHTLHRKGKTDTFPSNPRLYLNLVNDPVLTLALWHDLSPTPARLQQVADNRYVGQDGAGTSAAWEYLIRTPRLHVMLCTLDYVTPRGNSRLNGRIVVVVRSGFFREVNGEFWVQHDIEMFVKIDSKGWKAVAATVRPIVERVLEDQLYEAGLFVSVMARMVEMYPDWASEVASRKAAVPPEAKAAFVQVVKETRRPGAYSGRPRLADADPSAGPAPVETLRR